MKVVYIAGPFRGPNHYTIHRNTCEAEDLALSIWANGAAALCPHLNTRNFQDALPDRVWLDGDLELLRRCDALITTERWLESRGAKAEVRYAEEHNIPVFHWLGDLCEWLRSLNTPK